MARFDVQPLTDACDKFRHPKCDGHQTGLRTTRPLPPRRILPELQAASRRKVARRGRRKVVQKAVEPGRALYRSDARNPPLASPQAPQAPLARGIQLVGEDKFFAGCNRGTPEQKTGSRGD